MTGLDPTSLLPTLLADGRLFTGDFSSVGRAAAEGGRMHASDAMVVLGLLLTLVSGVSIAAWLSRQRLQPHRLVVFDRLAREAGLTLRQRWLLVRIGRFCELPTPLTLMLCPGTLGRCARRYAEATRRRGRSRRLAECASMRRHLFGAAAASAG